ncbi:MAG: reverse transcriptase domain-containing protein, partial [Cyanobacteria bacterium J06553_1]
SPNGNVRRYNRVSPNSGVLQVLKDAYWHVPIHKRYRPFLAFSAGKRVYQFRVLPFGLNIAPRVFTRILRPVHNALAQAGVQMLMYLDDWLVFASSAEECNTMVETTLQIGRRMGLLFNLDKSHLLPTKRIQWLGMIWDSVSSTLSLSEDNRMRCRKKLFRAIHTYTLSRRQWESLMGSLIHAAPVVPLGRLRTRRLLRTGLQHFRSLDRDTPVPFPRRLKNLLMWWSSGGRLGSETAWIAPRPFLTLTTDASNSGWGYQSSMGHQGAGVWDEPHRRRHINTKELRTVYLALLREPDIRQGTVHVLSDNMTTVHCINKQGTVRSSSLLQESEILLEEAHRRGLVLQASYLAGSENTWADALSRGLTTSIEWSLSPDTFALLCDWAGEPEVDLFASHPLLEGDPDQTVQGPRRQTLPPPGISSSVLLPK